MMRPKNDLFLSFLFQVIIEWKNEQKVAPHDFLCGIIDPSESNPKVFCTMMAKPLFETSAGAETSLSHSVMPRRFN